MEVKLEKLDYPLGKFSAKKVSEFNEQIDKSVATTPLGWSTEKLKTPHASVPFNPLLAERMYMKGYIERLGTGTADRVRIALANKLKEPVFEQMEEFKTILYRPGTNQATKYRPSTPQPTIKLYGSEKPDRSAPR